MHVENVLHVIFRYLLLHKGDANNVLPTGIAYRSVQRYGYCVSDRSVCIAMHRCIVPALSIYILYISLFVYLLHIYSYLLNEHILHVLLLVLIVSKIMA